MNGDSTPVTIHILDKEYRIGCPPGEREALVESAAYLSRKMKEIRDSGKVVGADRIAVMAALNMAHELLMQSRQEAQPVDLSLGNRIRALQNKIDAALQETRQMEL